MTGIREEFYHGWMIHIAQGQEGYAFQCHMCERQVSVTDAQYYSTCEHALLAGRLRADLESVRLSLTNFLHGKLQLLCLNAHEREALEHSIAQYINTANHQFS